MLQCFEGTENLQLSVKSLSSYQYPGISDAGMSKLLPPPPFPSDSTYMYEVLSWGQRCVVIYLVSFIDQECNVVVAQQFICVIWKCSNASSWMGNHGENTASPLN